MFGASQLNGEGHRYSNGYDNHNYNKGVYFLDNNKDTLLQNKEYLITLGVPDGNPRNFPENMGIIVLKAQQNSYGKSQTFDIVDIKGNRMFNDESICYISHICDNYFLIGYDGAFGGYRDDNTGYMRPVIYNLKTKKTLLIDNYQNSRSYVYLYNSIWSGKEAYEYSQSGNAYCFFTDYPLKPVGSYKSLLVVKADLLNKVFDFYYFMNDGAIEKVKVRCNR